MGEALAIAMVVAVCAVLLFGYPVALTLGGVSLLFAASVPPQGRWTSRCSARCRSAFSAS